MSCCFKLCFVCTALRIEHVLLCILLLLERLVSCSQLRVCITCHMHCNTCISCCILICWLAGPSHCRTFTNVGHYDFHGVRTQLFFTSKQLFDFFAVRHLEGHSLCQICVTCGVARVGGFVAKFQEPLGLELPEEEATGPDARG